MVFFVLGYIAGMVTAAVLAVAVLFFRKPLSGVLRKVEREVEMASTRTFVAKGFVFEPPSDEDVERERSVQENSRRGRDTKISELQ